MTSRVTNTTCARTRHDKTDFAAQHADANAGDGERGVALLLTILTLLLVSALGISALNRAQDERTSSSTSRRKITNVAAAEAALKLVERQLAAAQSGAAPASTPIDIPAFVTEMGGLSTRIRTGTVGDGAAQQIVPIGLAADKSGDLRVGRGAAPRLIYRVNVVASHPTGANVQLQAQFSVKQ
jgi:hypothetical protein